MLFPVTYRVNERGHMEIGGCDLLDLAAAHGTPLYLYDEETVRARCREYVSATDDHRESGEIDVEFDDLRERNTRIRLWRALNFQCATGGRKCS